MAHFRFSIHGNYHHEPKFGTQQMNSTGWNEGLHKWRLYQLSRHQKIEPITHADIFEAIIHVKHFSFAEVTSDYDVSMKNKVDPAMYVHDQG